MTGVIYTIDKDFSLNNFDSKITHDEIISKINTIVDVTNFAYNTPKYAKLKRNLLTNGTPSSLNHSGHVQGCGFMKENNTLYVVSQYVVIAYDGDTYAYKTHYNTTRGTEHLAGGAIVGDKIYVVGNPDWKLSPSKTMIMEFDSDLNLLRQNEVETLYGFGSIVWDGYNLLGVMAGETQPNYNRLSKVNLSDLTIENENFLQHDGDNVNHPCISRNLFYIGVQDIVLYRGLYLFLTYMTGWAQSPLIIGSKNNGDLYKVLSTNDNCGVISKFNYGISVNNNGVMLSPNQFSGNEMSVSEIIFDGQDESKNIPKLNEDITSDNLLAKDEFINAINTLNRCITTLNVGVPTINYSSIISNNEITQAKAYEFITKINDTIMYINNGVNLPNKIN